MKTLVVYYYDETSITLTNLAYFFKHGIIRHEDYMYFFIINNSLCSINFHEETNIKIIKRVENDADLVSYNWFFEKMDPLFFKDFERFYFISSICIGPFITPIVELNWIELFNKRLESCDLLSPVIEFPPDTKGYSILGIESQLNIPFLHAYMFGTNISSINLLINIFKDFTSNKTESIINYERLLTTKYLLNNKKISSLLLAFKNIDVNDKSLWNYKLWNKNENTCYETSEAYFGLDLNPLEIIFIKNIPKASNISKNLRKQLMNYTVWH
jgi:hypothetical protein